MPGRFLDTNILLYLASGDAAKADRAERLVKEGGTISVQCLNEAASVARRKMRLSWEETTGFLSVLRALLDVVPLTLAIHDTGLALAQTYKLSLFDALIAAAALHSNCDTLLSEDMHAGLMIENRLRIVNPF